MTRGLERTTVRIQNWLTKENDSLGKIRKAQDTWGNLETRERRDRELIEEYLNEAPENIEATKGAQT